MLSLWFGRISSRGLYKKRHLLSIQYLHGSPNLFVRTLSLAAAQRRLAADMSSNSTVSSEHKAC